MSSEQTEVNNQTPVTTPEPAFSREDMEKSLQIRLQKERAARENAERENREFRARIDELQKKVDSGKATQNETREYYETNNAQTRAQQAADNAQSSGMMTKEQADQYINHRVNHEVNMNNMIHQVKDAADKDPEFKDLISANNTTQRLTDPECAFIANLPGIKNKAALIKHLLKNDKDNHILKIAGSNYAKDNGAEAAKFLYGLSEDLENNLSKPGPSPFRPVPNLQDVGKSDDFDVEEYINSKY